MGQGDPPSENVASLPEFEGTSLLRRHWAVNDVMAQVDVNDVVALVTYELARRGEIPTVRVGKKYVRVPSAALERWVIESGLDMGVPTPYTTRRKMKR